MAKDRRLELFVCAAIVAHLVVIAVLPRAKRNDPPTSPEILVTLEDLAPTLTPTRTLTPARTRTLTPTLSSSLSALSSTTTTIAPDTTSLVTPETTSAASTSSSSAPPSSLFLDRGSIGLDGPGSFRMEIAKQQSTATPEQQAAADMNRALRDPHVGEGPVAQELERVTRRTEGTPFEGRAVFAVRVDELGLVVSVGVSESSGDRHAWEEVAVATMNALAQKRMHVPPGAKGMSMQIEIASSVRLPSGARNPLSVGSPMVDGLTQLAHGTTDKREDNAPLVQGTFDLSDIGAHPARVVGSRVLSQNVF